MELRKKWEDWNLERNRIAKPKRRKEREIDKNWINEKEMKMTNSSKMNEIDKLKRQEINIINRKITKELNDICSWRE